MDNIIGKRINAALALKNVKQKELAKKIGVKDNVVSYWCNGSRTPNTEQIIKISKFLNVSTDYLFGLREEPTNNAKISDICDYTGLSEYTVKYFHLSKYSCTNEFLEELIYKIFADEIDFFGSIKEFISPYHLDNDKILDCIELTAKLNELTEEKAQCDNIDFDESHLEYMRIDEEIKKVENELNGYKYYLSKVFNNFLDEYLKNKADQNNE